VPAAGNLANLADSTVRSVVQLSFLADPALDSVVAIAAMRDGEQVSVTSALMLAASRSMLSVAADTYSPRTWRFAPGSYPSVPTPSGKPHDLTVLANADDVIVDLRRARVNKRPARIGRRANGRRRRLPPYAAGGLW
jgi:hypothetical protein